MSIVKREVWISPDGQFHESEADAIAYVERGEVLRHLEGALIEDGMEADEAHSLAKFLYDRFNITIK